MVFVRVFFSAHCVSNVFIYSIHVFHTHTLHKCYYFDHILCAQINLTRTSRSMSPNPPVIPNCPMSNSALALHAPRSVLAKFDMYGNKSDTQILIMCNCRVLLESYNYIWLTAI